MTTKKKTKRAKRTLKVDPLVLRDLIEQAMVDVVKTARMIDAQRTDINVDLWDYIDKTKYNSIKIEELHDGDVIYGGCIVKNALKNTCYAVSEYNVDLCVDDGVAMIDLRMTISKEPIGRIHWM